MGQRSSVFDITPERFSTLDLFSGASKLSVCESLLFSSNSSTLNNSPSVQGYPLHWFCSALSISSSERQRSGISISHISHQPASSIDSSNKIPPADHHLWSVFASRGKTKDFRFRPHAGLQALISSDFKTDLGALANIKGEAILGHRTRTTCKFTTLRDYRRRRCARNLIFSICHNWLLSSSATKLHLVIPSGTLILPSQVDESKYILSLLDNLALWLDEPTRFFPSLGFLSYFSIKAHLILFGDQPPGESSSRTANIFRSLSRPLTCVVDLSSGAFSEMIAITTGAFSVCPTQVAISNKGPPALFAAFFSCLTVIFQIEGLYYSIEVPYDASTDTVNPFWTGIEWQSTISRLCSGAVAFNQLFSESLRDNTSR